MIPPNHHATNDHDPDDEFATNGREMEALESDLESDLESLHDAFQATPFQPSAQLAQTAIELAIRTEAKTDPVTNPPPPSGTQPQPIPTKNWNVPLAVTCFCSLAFIVFLIIPMRSQPPTSPSPKPSGTKLSDNSEAHSDEYSKAATWSHRPIAPEIRRKNLQRRLHAQRLRISKQPIERLFS